jgi:hypothetical protein
MRRRRAELEHRAAGTGESWKWTYKRSVVTAAQGKGDSLARVNITHCLMGDGPRGQNAKRAGHVSQHPHAVSREKRGEEPKTGLF